MRWALIVTAGLWLLQGCSDGENGITVSKPPPQAGNPVPMQIPQPYVLVPVPQDSWGRPQVPMGWGQPPQTAAPQRLYQQGGGGNPWQPSAPAQPQPQYPTPGVWGQGGVQQAAPVMPQFRPLDERHADGRQGGQMAAPYDRPEGSSRNPGQLPYGYGYPGYATGPYGYPGAPGTWGMTAPWPAW